MNQKLTNQLYEKYPDFFADRTRPMNETCMCWGFDCGNGWYDILDEMCGEIEEVFKQEPDLRGVLRAVQVKEKFGTLRVYTNYYHEKISDIINKAEEKSENVCEICGQPGKLLTEGWIFSVRCDNCR